MEKQDINLKQDTKNVTKSNNNVTIAYINWEDIDENWFDDED